MTEQPNTTRRTRSFLLILALAAATPSLVLAQPTLGEANMLIDRGRAHLRYGADLERAGDVDGAMQEYAMAADSVSQALQIGDIWNVPRTAKPAGLYFLYGQSALSRAQLAIQLRDDPARINNHLFQAERAFRDTLEVVDYQQPQGSWEWAGRKSEAIFSLGTVFFIRGDLRSARRAMLDVLQLNPRHVEARNTLDAIDYLEGRRPQRRTASGRMIPDRPHEGLSGNRVMEYSVEIGKALFGRWGTVAGMLFEDFFKE
jgi:tetratricopeptide (TPR) repeat protein